ncbi:Protein ROLLING AND ERECT LEAF 2 [Linum grandiflorum]
MFFHSKMGSMSSKPEKVDILRLCKERRRFIQQAIDSRYNLAAAHLSYIDSLKTIGVSLNRFAEAELSTTESELDNDKSPSHSSYPSHNTSDSGSPFHNETPAGAVPPAMNVSYMKSGGGVGSTVTILQDENSRRRSSVDGFDEDEEMLGFSVMPPVGKNANLSWSYRLSSNSQLQAPRTRAYCDYLQLQCLHHYGFVFCCKLQHVLSPTPPPPPPPPFSGSWDYFNTTNSCESFRFVAQNDELELLEWNGRAGSGSDVIDAKGKRVGVGLGNKAVVENSNSGNLQRKGSSPEGKFHSMTPDGKDRQQSIMAKNCVSAAAAAAEREDPLEFITHRAKDFISSIKEIDHRFFRASESGKEISRMLEANNFRIGKSAITFSGAISEPAENGAKVITWKRTTSSRSSSSRNPLNNGTKDDVSDSGSDFVEEFCMFSGSHSSTLDRLYAWERKLYDEVKASESIRKDYEQKCDKLRHQFAKDHNAQLIEKTRAAAKALHSRIRIMHRPTAPLEKNNNKDAADGEIGTKDQEKSDDVSAKLSYIHTTLAKVLERLNKFSEASLKMYEDIRQKSEAARVAYSTCSGPV